jgi:hypothetical protein
MQEHAPNFDCSTAIIGIRQAMIGTSAPLAVAARKAPTAARHA